MPYGHIGHVIAVTQYYNAQIALVQSGGKGNSQGVARGKVAVKRIHTAELFDAQRALTVLGGGDRADCRIGGRLIQDLLLSQRTERNVVGAVGILDLPTGGQKQR